MDAMDGAIFDGRELRVQVSKLQLTIVLKSQLYKLNFSINILIY